MSPRGDPMSSIQEELRARAVTLYAIDGGDPDARLMEQAAMRIGELCRQRDNLARLLGKRRLQDAMDNG